MISICAASYDINGQVISHGGVAILQSAARRARRVATLDGGAVLQDQGWSDGDMTYQVRIPDSDGSAHLALTTMMANHGSAVLSCSRGCYRVLLSGLTVDKTTTVVTAEVLEAI